MNTDTLQTELAVRDLSGVALGSVIGGRYRVERVLGIGGMGTVFEGKHLGLTQQVAIKVLRADRASSREHVARFAREARAASSIESEHIVRVLDVGTLDTGAPFMVLEPLRGADLARILKERGPLSVEDAIAHVLSVCEVLAEAHKKGIVHRDLKPSNLFLAQRSDGTNVLKVLDFGVTKFLGSAQADEEAAVDGDFLTNTSSVVGSPQYIAPEQIRNARKVDTRVDIWALGVCLFRLLTKKYPFVGGTAADLYASILVNPPIPLRSEQPELSVELEAVVQKCLEKMPDDRYGDVGELARALAPFALGSADAVKRIEEIMAGQPVSSLKPIESDDEIELATVDLMFDAAVVLPGQQEEYLTTSAGISTQTDPVAARRTSSLPFVVAGIGVMLAFVAAAVIFLVLPTQRGPSAAPATTEAPPPATTLVPDPPASPSTSPIASVSVAATAPAIPPAHEARTAKPVKPLPPKPPTTTAPKPALSEIPSYGGRK